MSKMCERSTTVSMNISRNFNPYGSYQKQISKAEIESQKEDLDVNNEASSASQSSSYSLPQDDQVLNNMPTAYYDQFQFVAEQKPVESEDGTINLFATEKEQPPEASVEQQENAPATTQSAPTPPYATGDPDIDNAIASSSEKVQQYFTLHKQDTDLKNQLNELSKQGVVDPALEIKYVDNMSQIAINSFTLADKDRESINSIRKIKTDKANKAAAEEFSKLTPEQQAKSIADAVKAEVDMINAARAKFMKSNYPPFC